MSRLHPLAAVLLAALVLRLPLLLHPGCQCDVRPFAVWGWAASEGGLKAAYERGADYPPLYLYALGGLAGLGRAIQLPAPNLREQTAPGVTALVKLPALLGDLLLIAAVYLAARSLTAQRNAVIAGGLVAFNPALLYASVLWGQVDSLHTAFMVLTLAAALSARAAPAGAAAAMGLLVKAQSVVIMPVLVVTLLRLNSFIPRTGERGGSESVALPVLSRALGGAALAALVILIPAAVDDSLDGVRRAYLGATERFPAITVNAYNAWYLATAGQGNWTGQPTPATHDGQPLGGPLTYRAVGFLLLGTWVLAVLALLIWRPDPRVAWVVAAAIALGFFTLPTQIHERYLYPALPFLAVVAWMDRRLLLLLGILTVTFLVNLAFVWPALPALDALQREAGLGLRLLVSAAHVLALLGVGAYLARVRPPAPT